jgi:hypothetical protein
VIGPDGNVIMTDKVGFVLRELVYGDDAAKTIQAEIQEGRRPPMWNQIGHPDYQTWLDIIQQKNQFMFDINNPEHQQVFGYARVILPPQGCQPYIEQRGNAMNPNPNRGVRQPAQTQGNRGYSPYGGGQQQNRNMQQYAQGNAGNGGFEQRVGYATGAEYQAPENQHDNGNGGYNGGYQAPNAGGGQQQRRLF